MYIKLYTTVEMNKLHIELCFNSHKEQWHLCI